LIDEPGFEMCSALLEPPRQARPTLASEFGQSVPSRSGGEA
jgi:hypothetical protein